MSLDGAVLFVGPTLSVDKAAAIFETDVRPPASYGDIYRVAVEEPRAILLVDGAFENTRAVFHKEILWALAQGIHVLGSSSIGALRAAELDVFGMVGIGEIYEAYRDGRLERDDAVAVLHGPAELGWPLLTRALVDIEATLTGAERQGVLSEGGRSTLQKSAREIFWRERTFQRIIERAQAAGWQTSDALALQNWLSENEISQKQRDAVALLHHVVTRWETLTEPFRPSFRFENTVVWEALRSEINCQRHGISRIEFERIAADLHRDGAYDMLELEALVVLLAEDVLQESSTYRDDGDFQNAAAQFRLAKGLWRSEDVVLWMENNQLTHSDYVALVSDFGDLEKIRAKKNSRLPDTMLRILRGRGMLEHYLQRIYG